MSNFWKILWVFTLIILAVQMFIYYPELPQKMAVHFDFKGNPDGWSSKDSFLGLWILAIILVNMWLPLMGLIIKKFPKQLINLPHKDYWLADEKRKQHAMAVTENMMAMIFSVVNLLFIYLMKYTYDLNIKGHSVFKIWVIFIPVIFIIIFPIIYLYKKLRVPPGKSN